LITKNIRILIAIRKFAKRKVNIFAIHMAYESIMRLTRFIHGRMIYDESMRCLTRWKAGGPD
jgi:hypothetical protein